MDSNGTHFQLLLGYEDWSNCTDALERRLGEVWESSPLADDRASGLKWEGERHEILLQPRLFRFTAAPKDQPPALENRRGAARDRFGNWYWIDANRTEIRVNSAGTGLTTHFWSTNDSVACERESRFGDFQPKVAPSSSAPLLLSALAVTTDHFLVVGVLQPAGLLIFDLHAGGPPRQMFWPERIPFTPFDMAARPCGGVWILDREQQCYWALDRNLNVIKQDQFEATPAEEQLDDFQPKDGSPTRGMPALTFPQGLTLDAVSPLNACDPVAIEALPDDTVLILDHNPVEKFSRLFRYRYGRQLGDPVALSSVIEIVDEQIQTSFTLKAHDCAFVPEHDETQGQIADCLYVVAADGNQAFAFHIAQHNDQLSLQPIAAFLPMRLFGGKGLVAANERVYYDFRETWIPLVEQGRPRYASEAALHTPAWDGREPNCTWHRLMLEGCLPPETQVQVWSRAANEESELAYALWQREPDLYRRGDGSEQPFVRRSKNEHYGTWELLFQRATGRFVQLKLKLMGNGRNTPHIRAVRAYYPRFSYLKNYLPAVYREERESASFLERYLANLEGLYTTLEDKIAAVQMLFDVRSAPAEVLDWLGNWFGLALDPAWDERKRRLLLKHAMLFFQFRGTIRGLRMALRLALEDCAEEQIFSEAESSNARPASIRIVEKYRTRRTPGVVLGDPTALAGLREVLPAKRWQPSQGRENLHARYREALGLTSEAELFPLSDPGNERSRAWRQFCLETLGFIPAATSADEAYWQNFLERRYYHVNAYNAAYQLNTAQALFAFGQAELPNELPKDGAPLADWFQFEGVVVAMRRNAHHFTVLLPTPRLETSSTTEAQRRRDLAERIITLEKPAHTTFDIKFFWALFRVGAARLGEDTLIDLGSRAPQLSPSMVLGQGYLSESFLAPGHPQNVADRLVLGKC